MANKHCKYISEKKIKTAVHDKIGDDDIYKGCNKIILFIQNECVCVCVFQGVMDDDDDALLVEAADAIERQVGGGSVSTDRSPGRFVFRLEAVVDRRSNRFGVHERVFNVHVQQEGQFHRHQRLTDTLVHGLCRAMHSVLDQEDIDDRDRVYFTLGSQRIDNAYQAYGTTAGEWRTEAPRVDALLQNLSRMLNSNQQFEMGDSFQLAFVHVRGDPRGGGA